MEEWKNGVVILSHARKVYACRVSMQRQLISKESGNSIINRHLPAYTYHCMTNDWAVRAKPEISQVFQGTQGEGGSGGGGGGGGGRRGRSKLSSAELNVESVACICVWLELGRILGWDLHGLISPLRGRFRQSKQRSGRGQSRQ